MGHAGDSYCRLRGTDHFYATRDTRRLRMRSRKTSTELLAVVLATSVGAVLAPAGASSDSSASGSSITVNILQTAERVRATGRVEPSRAGQAVKVSYWKKNKSNNWVRRGLKQVTLNADSRYRARFQRGTAPPGASCKVIAKYLGDAGTVASKAASQFPC